MTNIQWVRNADGTLGETWNPVVGCSVVSLGCTNCYAMRDAHRRLDGTMRDGRLIAPQYEGTTKLVNGNPVWTGKIGIASDKTFAKPLHWTRPRMIFVNSMGDLFHEDIPDAVIDRVFAVMALCPQHTFQVLTKRSARMREYMIGPWSSRVMMRLSEVASTAALCDIAGHYASPKLNLALPLPNVWLGVSAEDQRRADERIPDLLATPAAVRFVSAEPLVGPIDFTFVGNAEPVAGSVRYDALTGHAIPYDGVIRGIGTWATNKATPCTRLDWIIVGGESGKGVRPMHPDWVRSIRDQCSGRDDRLHLLGYPGVPFFFKQWGEWLWSNDDQNYAAAEEWRRRHFPTAHAECHSSGHTALRVGKARAGRNLDGRTHDAMPTTQREVAA